MTRRLRRQATAVGVSRSSTIVSGLVSSKWVSEPAVATAAVLLLALTTRHRLQNWRPGTAALVPRRGLLEDDPPLQRAAEFLAARWPVVALGRTPGARAAVRGAGRAAAGAAALAPVQDRVARRALHRQPVGRRAGAVDRLRRRPLLAARPLLARHQRAVELPGARAQDGVRAAGDAGPLPAARPPQVPRERAQPVQPGRRAGGARRRQRPRRHRRHGVARAERARSPRRRRRRPSRRPPSACSAAAAAAAAARRRRRDELLDGACVAMLAELERAKRRAVANEAYDEAKRLKERMADSARWAPSSPRWSARRCSPSPARTTTRPPKSRPPGGAPRRRARPAAAGADRAAAVAGTAAARAALGRRRRRRGRGGARPQ